MFKNISSLSISGKCFAKGCNLDLFKQRINIVYGRNGSGKSTISQAISNIATGATDNKIISSFSRPLTPEEEKNIFIYDERFVDNKIRISYDGFDTIVMFGNQKDIKEKIDGCDKEIQQNKIEQEKLLHILEKLDSDKNENSSKYWRKTLEEALKKKGNFWAERDRKILQNRKNSPVNEALIDSIVKKFFQFSATSTISEDITLQESESSRLGIISENILHNIDDYLNAKTYEPIRQSIRTIIAAPNWNTISTNLSSIVNEPSLSNREKALLEKIKNKVLPDYLSESINFFGKDTEICPFCLRIMSDLDITQLNTTLSNILNDEVQEFKKQVKSNIDEINHIYEQVHTLGDLSFIFPQEPIAAEIENYKIKKSKVEKALKSLVNNLLEKEKHPYLASDITFIDNTKFDFNSYTASIEAIVEAIKQHNAKRAQLDTIKNNLQRDNTDLAVCENYDSIRNYLLKEQYEKEIKQRLLDFEAKISAVENEKSKFEAELKNVNLALDRINDSLSFIFFDSDRLALVNKNGLYCVKSRNHEIKPEDLSVGERNAISLAYFFASMHKDCHIEDVYKEGRLVVIDDPITSFDVENRVGILSFLHWQTEQILKGNENSKILFLSHDIQTIFDLYKFANNLEKEKSQKITDEIKHAVAILEDGSLTDLKGRRGILLNEYKGLFLDVFKFANVSNVSFAIPVDGIGNKIRKIAEAISTFLYGCSIEQLFRKEQLLDNMPDFQKEHYRNTLFRLVCHGMSHSEEKIKSFNPTHESFAPKEVQKIAKSFLLFICDTHELHLVSMIGIDKVNIVKKWKKDFFTAGAIKLIQPENDKH